MSEERIAAAKRAAAENLAAENATAEKEKVDAEKCEAKKVAEKCAAMKAAEKSVAMKAAEKCATKEPASEETEKAAAESAVTSVSAPDVASTSCMGSQPTPGETCWNYGGYFTPDNQCDSPPEHISVAVTVFPHVPPCPAEVAVVSSPCPSSSPDLQGALPAKSKVGRSEVQSSPLPLCHYCCHLGSGANPVHYSLQCLCPGKVCTCQYSCLVEQLEHRKSFSPEVFRGASMLPVSPMDQLRAKALAEKRIGQWPIWPCTSEHCVKPVSP